MVTRYSGSALKATLVVSSENFVPLILRLGGGHVPGQHERLVCSIVAHPASSQMGIAQIGVLLEHRNGAQVYYTARFHTADVGYRFMSLLDAR